MGVRSIINQKSVKNVTIHNVLKVAWAKYDCVWVIDLKENFLLLEFDEEEEEKTSILDQLPWSIQGHRLNIKKMGTSLQPERGGLQLYSILDSSTSITTWSLKLNEYEPHRGRNRKVHWDGGVRWYRKARFPTNKSGGGCKFPLITGFWWTNTRGEEQWANVKY